MSDWPASVWLVIALGEVFTLGLLGRWLFRRVERREPSQLDELAMVIPGRYAFRVDEFAVRVFCSSCGDLGEIGKADDSPLTDADALELLTDVRHNCWTQPLDKARFMH